MSPGYLLVSRANNPCHVVFRGVMSCSGEACDNIVGVKEVS